MQMMSHKNRHVGHHRAAKAPSAVFWVTELCAHVCLILLEILKQDAIQNVLSIRIVLLEKLA